MAEIHNNTVHREKGDDTKKMAGDVLLQAIKIFVVNKHEQGIGESADLQKFTSRTK